MISESIFKKITTAVYSMLQALDPALTYHTAQHTRQVMQDAADLYFAEKNHESADLYLLKTAALLHDTGFLSTYEGHEEESCVIATGILKEYDQDEKVIATILDLIRATKIPQTPKSLLAEILCDADLYYLGTKNFKPIAGQLFAEWKHFGIVNTVLEFDRMQIRFFESHHFFTRSAQLLLDKKKEAHLMEIKKRIDK